MTSAHQIVNQAKNGDYLGIPYSELDCQGLIKRIMRDCKDSRYATGSNYMWRYWVEDVTQDAARAVPGMLAFTLKSDGGEIQRGYHDSAGNAAHVGLVLDNDMVMHSSKGGVQLTKIIDKRWTHFAKIRDVMYDEPENPQETEESILSLLGEILAVLKEIESHDH